MPILYIDGQSIGNEQRGQPRRARIAVVYESRVLAEEVGDKTNNEAEYLALLKALFFISKRWAAKDGGVIPTSVGTVRIRSDSELLVKQMGGEYRVQEERLRDLRDRAKDLMDRMGSVKLEWVPRERNQAGLWLEGKWKGGKAEPD